MRSHVGLQVVPFGKGTITVRALVWLFSSVHAHMDLQAARLRETLLTLVALKWPLAGMSAAMLGQTAVLCKRLVAELTLVRLFTSVDTSVSLEVSKRIEGLFTMLTLMDFLGVVKT